MGFSAILSLSIGGWSLRALGSFKCFIQTPLVSTGNTTARDAQLLVRCQFALTD